MIDGAKTTTTWLESLAYNHEYITDGSIAGALLLKWFNFNPGMDK